MSTEHELRAAATGLPNGQLPLEGVATAGQPDADDVRRLAEAGYRVVVDLRGPGEPRGFDEAAAVREAGMEYVNLPVTGPPSDETFEALRDLLRDAERRPALVHCGSANRVGGAIIPYLVLDQGKGPEDALRTAERIGLRSRELADHAIEYAARRNQGLNPVHPGQ